jgi:ribosomal protein S30
MHNQAHLDLVIWGLQTGDVVIIDRTTEFGNPYIISPEHTRQWAMAQHGALVKTGHYDDLLPRLVGKQMACWCAPRTCHGENYIRRMKKLGLE